MSTIVDSTLPFEYSAHGNLKKKEVHFQRSIYNLHINTLLSEMLVGRIEKSSKVFMQHKLGEESTIKKIFHAWILL